MNTLHLSVINDGATYPRRLEIARSGFSDATKFHLYMKLVCAQAELERKTMDVPYTLDDLSAAATETFRYMERHIAECLACRGIGQ